MYENLSSFHPTPQSRNGNNEIQAINQRRYNLEYNEVIYAVRVQRLASYARPACSCLHKMVS